MKFATLRKSLVLGVVSLSCSSAFAANKGNLRLKYAVTVNGTTTVGAGDYKVLWEGNGPNVELSIIQGKNIIAKVPARVVELETPYFADGADTQENGSQPRLLVGIHFQGKRFWLELATASGGIQPSSRK
ncbi:MAG: hypothetical protein WB799_22430 [Candidatus Sulfotelmatobacter sp.]